MQRKDQYTKDFKKKIVEGWLSEPNNVSKEGFARKNGISARSLGRWVEQYVEGLVKVDSLQGTCEEGGYTKKESAESNFTESNFTESEPPENKPPEISYVGTGASITLYRGPESASVPKGSDQYELVMDAIFYNDLQGAWDCANTSCNIEKWSEGNILVEDGVVVVKGFPVSNVMTDKLLTMIKEDPKQAVVFARFVESLMEVGDQRVVNELYEFLKHNSIKLNEDGSFTGYKAVQSSYKDKWTGNLDNSPGSTVEMPRSMVDKDKNKTCSAGLHVGSLDYASNTFYSSGDRVVSVKVMPCDVVSVPVDYNGQKLRACKYTVMEDITGKLLIQ